MMRRYIRHILLALAAVIAMAGNAMAQFKYTLTMFTDAAGTGATATDIDLTPVAADIAGIGGIIIAVLAVVMGFRYIKAMMF